MNVYGKSGFLIIALAIVLLPGCTLDIKLETFPSSAVSNPITTTVEYSSKQYRDYYSQSGHHGHTASYIGDGKILVVGGRKSAAGIFPTNSVEIFSTVSKRWSTAPNYPSPVIGHTATTFSDGTVLIVGGADFDMSTTTVSSAVYLYNPTTNSFTQKASMNVARYYHTATLLGDGKVLVTGGSIGGTSLSSVELYDPVANTWTVKASLLNAVAKHTATLLSDGKVFVAGGNAGATGTTAQTTAAVYNPTANTWTAAPALAQARAEHSATLLDDGTVLVAGGNASSTTRSTAVIFNPTLNSFSSATAMPQGRYGHTAVNEKGWVIMTGGASNLVIAFDSCIAYNPYTNAWVSLSSFSNARNGHSATLIDDTLFALAGSDSVGGGLGVGESLDLTNLIDAVSYSGAALGLPSWSQTANFVEGKVMHQMVALNNGKALSAGGLKFNVPQASTAVYDPATNLWSVGPNMSEGRYYHTVTLLPSGKVFIAGGYNGTSVSATADIYDPASNSFTTVALPRGRYAHVATVLENGKLMLSGGAGASGFLVETDIYDESNGSWTTAADRPTGGYVETISRLGGNKYLIVGVFASAVYDATNDNWTVTTPITPRSYHTAEVLPNGKVLIIGGQDSGNVVLSTTEIYNPATNTWAAAASLPVALGAHTSAKMNSGKIVVIGGQSGADTITNVRFYDYQADQWSEGTPLADARKFHASTMMPNGRILVYGGQSNIFGFLPFWEQILDP